MTQYYKMPGFSLGSANLSTKVLLTAFLVTVLAGLAVALLQYLDRAGPSERDVVTWIHGNDDDPRAAEIRGEKSYRELLSITHEHAFALPMLFFVLLHLVALTSIGEPAKIALYLGGFGSLAATMGAPWLVRYGGAHWAPLLRWGGTAMTGTIALSATICLFETWLARPLRRVLKRPEPPAPDPLVGRREEPPSDPP